MRGQAWRTPSRKLSVNIQFLEISRREAGWLSEGNVEANTHVAATFCFQRAQSGRFKVKAVSTYGSIYIKGVKVQLGSGQVILPGSGRFTPKVRFPVSLKSTVGRCWRAQKPKAPARNRIPPAVLSVFSPVIAELRHTFVTKLEPTATTHSFQIQFNIILIPRPRSPKRYFPLQFSDLNRKC